MAQIIRHRLINTGYRPHGMEGTEVIVETPAGLVEIAFEGFTQSEASWRKRYMSDQVSKILKLREEGADHAKTVVTRHTVYGRESKTDQIRSTESPEAILQALTEAGFKRPPLKEQGRLGALIDHVLHRS